MTDHRIRVSGFRGVWGRWAYHAVCSCGSSTTESHLRSWRQAMRAADWHRRAVLRAAIPDDLSTLGVS